MSSRICACAVSQLVGARASVTLRLVSTRPLDVGVVEQVPRGDVDVLPAGRRRDGSGNEP